MGLLVAGSLLALLAYTSATPIVQQKSRSGFIDLPKSYAALGDSFAAGLGSGLFLNNSRDASDIECIRQDGSYPTQLLQFLPFLLPKDQPFDFTACTGDVLDDIDGQIAKLTGRKFDVLTVTIGGNDFGFSDIAVACAYATITPGVDAQAVCDAALDAAFAIVDGPAILDKFEQKFDLIKSSSLAPGGTIFVTGYGRLFDDPIEGDACDQISFFPIVELAALNITASNRLRSNALTLKINALIEKAVSKAGDEFQFIDFDKVFEGKRFCEQDNADDPIGANNPNVFFNDLTTIEPTPGVAPLDKQTPGLTGVDITDLLQRVQVFHPKGSLPHTALAAEIAFKILIDVFKSHDVVVGPAKYCGGSKHWRRGDDTCYDIPDKCAMAGQECEDAPTVVCENGDSYAAKIVA